MTAYANVLDGYEVDLVEVKVTKGNGLQNIVTETFDGNLFQKPDFVDIGNVSATVPVTVTGQEKAKDTSKAVRVTKQIAALGARGDYIEFKLYVTAGSGTPTFAKAVKNILVDAFDFSGVPVAVQHAVFGKYSPFVTPTQPVSMGMIQGVDKQVIELTNETALTEGSGTTATSQKIRGSEDDRLTYVADNTAQASTTYFVLKVKPNSDGVIVIPRGAKIWAGISPKATRTITAQA